MKKILFILPFLFLSCSIFQKTNTNKKKTSENISSTSMRTLDIKLGAIGSFHNNLTNKEFQTNAFPVLNRKVRISALVKNFGKSTLKQLKKVQLLDSSNAPAKFVSLMIIDKVSLVEELNNFQNKKVQTYIKNVEKSLIVNSVSLVFKPETLKKISTAQEVYLTSNKNNYFILELYHDDILKESIHLSDGIVFDYKSAHFCWGENDKHSIEITNITSDKCSKNTYKTYSKAFKKKEEFKY